MNDDMTLAQNTLVQKTFSPKDLELKVLEQKSRHHSFDVDFFSFLRKDQQENGTFAQNFCIWKNVFTNISSAISNL
jgi:hypothetical protein